ncbi:hypothetical protein AAHC03_022900 [Spirometra sp. Aus1]
MRYAECKAYFRRSYTYRFLPLANKHVAFTRSAVIGRAQSANNCWAATYGIFPRQHAMILSRMLAFGSARTLRMFSTQAPQAGKAVTAMAWLKKNYAVTYLIFVVSSGLIALTTYTITCVLRNPDLRLPFYDDRPRDEYYFNRHYFGAARSEDPRLPPVRMHYDGELEFPYDKPVKKFYNP